MLNSKNLGLSGGIIWGVSLFLMTWISIFTGYGSELLNSIGKLYPGYTISWTGSIWGLILGFVDGFVALYLLALLYNWMNSKNKNNDQNSSSK